jgi:hypothetical protein
MQRVDRVFQSARNTMSLKSGMMLLTGRPLLQNGVPQSMQRADCFFRFLIVRDDKLFVIFQ